MGKTIRSSRVLEQQRSRPAGTIAGRFSGLSRESTSVSFSPTVLRHDSTRAARGPRSHWAAPCLPPHRVSPVLRESRRLIDCASTCRSCRERALWVAPPLLLLDGACTQRSSCLLRELLIPHHLMMAASKPSFITQPWVPHRKRVIHLPSCHVCHRNRVIQLPSCFDS